MIKIENMDQLQSEIKRLRTQARKQEDQLRSDYNELREDLKPSNILWNALSSLTGFKINRKEFFEAGNVRDGISVLIRRFILRSERKMENKFYNVVDGLFGRIQNFVNKFSGAEARKQERRNQRETQDDE